MKRKVILSGVILFVGLGALFGVMDYRNRKAEIEDDAYISGNIGTVWSLMYGFGQYPDYEQKKRDAHMAAVTRPLIRAVAAGDLNGAKAILQKHPDEVNVVVVRGCTLLHVAVRNSDQEMVKMLISMGADVDQINARALPVAVDVGDVGMARLLISHGAVVDPEFDLRDLYPREKSGYGRTCAMLEYLISTGVDIDADNPTGSRVVHSAVSSGNLRLARYLVSRGANIGLFDAAALNDIPTLKKLVAAGADVNAVDDSRQRTPLHWAVDQGATDAADYLLQAGGAASINVTDETDRTPLRIAVDAGHTVLARKLVARGATVDLISACYLGDLETVKKLATKAAVEQASEEYTVFPLDAAASGGQIQVMRYLISKGIVGPERSVWLSNALVSAADKGQVEVARYLLQQGADINASSQREDTPLLAAAQNGHEDMVGFLLSNGAHINEPAGHSCGSETPLYAAVASGHEDVVKLLLARGAKTNELDDSEYTPLFWAAYSGHTSIARMLIARGAKVNTPNEIGGQTPLHAAAEYGDPKLLSLLISGGASVNVKDYQDRTPLYLAIMRGNTDAADLLHRHGGIAPKPLPDTAYLQDVLRDGPSL